VCGTELTAKAATKSKKAEGGMQASSMPQLTLSLPAALGALALILLIGASVYQSILASLPTITDPTAEGPPKRHDHAHHHKHFQLRLFETLLLHSITRSVQVIHVWYCLTFGVSVNAIT
jgi:hypothetical protein